MSATATRPKDVDNVLLRLPASVKARAATIAQSSHLSQNAFFSAAVLHWTIVYGEVPEIGSPENVRALVSAIGEALKDDFPVMGAFHSKDWKELGAIIGLLQDGDLITELRTKVDAKSTDTIVYSFQLTKVGRMMWPAFSTAILEKVAARLEV